MLIASAACLALIASFEGFGARLYNDPAGNCTIGYGRLVHPGPCDGRASEQQYASGVTREQADVMLRDDVRRFEDAVRQLVIVPLTQRQFDALVSFAYNVGPGAFQSSDLRARLNAGDYASVPRELRRWNKGSNGQVLPGLVRRRDAEAAMWGEGELKSSLVYYMQRDPQWGGEILGYNPAREEWRFRNVGCLATSLATVCGVTPGEVNEAGKRRGLFQPGTGIATTFEPRDWVPGSRWRKVYESGHYKNAAFPVDEYERLCNHIAGAGVAICEVQYPPRMNQHFLLAIAAPHKGPKQVVVIADPERRGEIEELERFYGRWDIALVRSILYSEVS